MPSQARKGLGAVSVIRVVAVQLLLEGGGVVHLLTHELIPRHEWNTVLQEVATAGGPRLEFVAPQDLADLRRLGALVAERCFFSTGRAFPLLVVLELVHDGSLRRGDGVVIDQSAHVERADDNLSTATIGGDQELGDTVEVVLAANEVNRQLTRVHRCLDFAAQLPVVDAVHEQLEVVQHHLPGGTPNVRRVADGMGANSDVARVDELVAGQLGAREGDVVPLRAGGGRHGQSRGQHNTEDDRDQRRQGDERAAEKDVAEGDAGEVEVVVGHVVRSQDGVLRCKMLAPFTIKITKSQAVFTYYLVSKSFYIQL